MIFIPLSSQAHLRFDMYTDRTTKALLMAYLSDISPIGGVYVYLSETYTPLYVGRSRRLYTRLLQHATPQGVETKLSEEWQSIGIVLTKHPILTERELIRQYNPPFNF